MVDFTVSASANVSLTSWNFGDPDNNNNTGSLGNATHTYNKAGYYLAVLSTAVPEAPPGNGNCLITENVSVCIPIAADFDYQAVCQTVIFSDLSTFLPGQNITGWSWDFGDSNSSTLSSPTHTYGSSGLYTVTLTVSNAAGCQASVALSVSVNGNPVPSILVNPNPACVGEPISFGGTAVGAIQWLWDFNDGSTFGDQNPSHTYLSPNTYNVTLTVENAEGCVGSVVETIIVHPAPSSDTIAYTPSLNICSGESVTLTAPSGTGYTYLWSTGAVSQSITTGVAGSYDVTVTDINDCTAIPDSVVVTVLPLPDAFISGPLFICDQDCITLSAPAGFGYTYQWLDHTNMPIPFQTLQNLTVCSTTILPGYSVMVTDANGCSATSQQTTVSLAVSPIFTIDVMPDSCELSVSTLTNTPIQPNVAYTWSTWRNWSIH